MSPVNKIKAREERTTVYKKKQNTTVGHSITSRISAYDKHKKKHPLSLILTLLWNVIDQGRVFFSGFQDAAPIQ